MFIRETRPDILVTVLINYMQKDVQIKELSISREVILRGYSNEELAEELVPIERIAQAVRRNTSFVIKAKLIYQEAEIETFSSHYVDSNGKIETDRFWIEAINKAPHGKQKESWIDEAQNFLKKFFETKVASMIAALGKAIS